MQKIKKKSAFILVGMPGSGKSTLAKKITKKLKATHLSSDKIREKLFKSTRYSNKGEDAVNELRKKVHATLFDRAAELLSKGKKIVIDATHLNPETRSLAIKILSKTTEKDQLCFVVISTSYETINQRMKEKTDSHTSQNETLYEGWKRVTSYFLNDFKSGKLSWPTKLESIDCFDHKEFLYELEK